MQSKLTIYWDDGRITELPDASFKFVGDQMAPTAEVDYRFDDLADGLYVEVRHHQAVAGDEKSRDKRGSACERRNDVFYQVFPALAADHILAVYHDGVKRLARIGGSLVSLAKIDALSSVYLSTDDTTSDIDAICGLHAMLARNYEGMAEDQIAANIADELGITVELLDMALETRAARAAEEEEGEGDDAADSEDYDDDDDDLGFV